MRNDLKEKVGKTITNAVIKEIIKETIKFVVLHWDDFLEILGNLANLIP
jgi:hypothetical protein